MIGEAGDLGSQRSSAERDVQPEIGNRCGNGFDGERGRRKTREGDWWCDRKLVERRIAVKGGIVVAAVILVCAGVGAVFVARPLADDPADLQQLPKYSPSDELLRPDRIEQWVPIRRP